MLTGPALEKKYKSAVTRSRKARRIHLGHRPFTPVDLPDREWPNRQTRKAPRWLSSDLRDGNQSNVHPMSIEQKTIFLKYLIKAGFKEIELAYPAASDTDFNFVRGVVDQKLGEAEGVWMQCLTPAREDLIRTTFASMRGMKRAILHMYNATSPCFRKVVFNNTKEQTVDLAVRHVKIVRQLIDESIARGDGTDWQFEYSPETFSQTEGPFAVDICNAVQEEFFRGKDRSKEHPIIFNLPATVEIATPNHYADQIEYFCRHINYREHVCISLHTHNDRGTGIAASELGLLAGGQRVEGCLFGNGERTGNVDIITMALNLYTQGVHPALDFSDIFSAVELVTTSNEIPVHPRHPYGGELVFTAFSGSHQDAIKKGLAAQAQRFEEGDGMWDVPYLPIDPADIGCTYEAVIRVNSQSGKGGIAYLVKQRLQLDLPRRLQMAFYQVVQAISDRTGQEMTTDDIEEAFRTAYHLGSKHAGRFVLVDYALSHPSEHGKTDKSLRAFNGKITDRGQLVELQGAGNGPLSACLDALYRHTGAKLEVREYHEHAVGEGSSTKAASYVELTTTAGLTYWGIGVDHDVAASSLEAVLSAASSALASGKDETISKLIKPDGVAVNGHVNGIAQKAEASAP